MGTRYSIQKLSSCPHISGTSRPAEGRHVDDAFFFAVHSQHGMDLVIIERGDVAGPQPQGHSRERHILGDVSGVEIDIAVGPFFILPLRTGEDSRPGKDDGRLSQKALVQSSFSHLSPEITRPEQIQLVLPDIIMKDTRLNPLNHLYGKIGLDRIQGSGRGSRTQRVFSHNLGHSLGCPEKLGQGGRAQRNPPEIPDAPPPAYCLPDGHPPRSLRHRKLHFRCIRIDLVRPRFFPPIQVSGWKPVPGILGLALETVSDPLCHGFPPYFSKDLSRALASSKSGSIRSAFLKYSAAASFLPLRMLSSPRTVYRPGSLGFIS